MGAVNTSVKVFETKEAVRAGADEIDMVLNIGALKDREYDYVLKEIEEVKNACQRDRKMCIRDRVLLIHVMIWIIMSIQIAKAMS